MDYGKKMDALRSELRDYFWDGEFRDTVGATVTAADGSQHHPYAVFISKRGGALGLAIANYEDLSVCVHVSLDGDHSLERYRTVDDETWFDLNGGILMPPRSAVVVV